MIFAVLILAAAIGVWIESSGKLREVVLSKDIADRVLIPDTHVLSIERQTSSPPSFFTDVEKKGSSGDLKCAILHSISNAQCIHDGQVSFCTSEDGTAFRTISLSKDETMLPFQDVMVFQAEHIGDAAYNLALKNQTERKSVFAVVRDGQGEEYVVLSRETGELSVSSVRSLLKSSLVSFDGGLNGYGIEVNMPRPVYIKIWPFAKPISASSGTSVNGI